MARKGVVKERLLQIFSVTTQVAISRRVSRFTLQLRDCQEARRSSGGGDDMPTHRWRGDGAWIGLRIFKTRKQEHVMRGKEQGQQME